MHTQEKPHTGRAAARRDRRRAAQRLPGRLRSALLIVGIAVLAAGAPGVAASYRARGTARTAALRDEAAGELQLQCVLLVLCLLLAVGVAVYAWRAEVRRPVAADDAEGAAQLAAARTELADARDAHVRERDTLLRERAALTQRIAGLQDNLQGTFVGLSRRTLGLVERQLSFIDTLEEHEQDADRLDTLFKLDHLAACMRRHSENLLVLAGADQRGAKREHVALIDVLRGAVGEIEAYQRIVIRPGLPEVRLNGFASGDTSHLIAELLENATACSPPTAPVELGGRLLESGELVLTVRDEGIGITPAERLAGFNELLARPEPGPPPGEERGLGLYVVARLAGRHGARVRLHTQSVGLTAEIRVPARLVVAAAAVVPGADGHAVPAPQPAVLPAEAPAHHPAHHPAPHPAEHSRTPLPEPSAPARPAPRPAQWEPAPRPAEHAPAAPFEAADQARPREAARDTADTPPPVAGSVLPRRKRGASTAAPRLPLQPASPTAPLDAAQVRRRLAGLQQGSREGWRAAAAEAGNRDPESSDPPGEGKTVEIGTLTRRGSDTEQGDR
ncbi:ATP-binding protein [Streptomyces polyrhachis]|uniref:histidine kinase n=1 Tax=Streptomyces polyrhachis TaxID=1282885 RepID=A0ABW2GGN6_9ACTN